jgi:hypothetical protein
MKTESAKKIEELNKNSLPVLNLDKINANSLPELQGWKEKQEILLSENPFIEIIDNTSYSEAKKRRTALLKGRTTIQGQDKLIGSKLKEVRTKVSTASNELINITIGAEEIQQDEVKKYEAKKEVDRLEKVRLLDIRKSQIKEKINSIFNEWTQRIIDFNFETIADVNIVEVLSNIDAEYFEEFASDFNEKTRILTQLFSEKKSSLQIEENQRLETLKLSAEREKFQEEQKVAKEKAEAQEQDRLKQQKIIDAQNKKKQDDLHEKERELNAEKKRSADIEAERRKKQEEADFKKLENENAAKKIKEEKAEKKRANDLKPDKQKLEKHIAELKFPEEDFKLNNTQSLEFLAGLDEELLSFKLKLKSNINLI